MTCARGALGERAMADFAAASRAEAADFARAVRRKVVVEHEALGGLAAGDGIEVLRILLGAEGAGHEGLRLAAVEDGRTVERGRTPTCAESEAELVLTAAIDAKALVEGSSANGLDFKGVEEWTKLMASTTHLPSASLPYFS